MQRRLADYILDRPSTDEEAASTGVASLVRERQGVDSAQRLGIYHNAYRVRLADVLADSFAKTCLYMGSDTFAEHATAFAVAHPPMARSLSRYGADLPAFLAGLYPDNPELHELAQLDWDLRTRFDGADVPALDPDTAQAAADGQAPAWLGWPTPLHPSLVLRSIRTNVAQLWRAMDADTDVPPAQQWAEERFLAVWRKGLQPHFQSMDADEAAFLRCLQAGQSVDQAATALAGTAVLPDPQRLGGWLQAWLNDGVLRLQKT
nr:DNA-binding domain-containing protein [Rhodoferax sp. AJA081-3]